MHNDTSSNALPELTADFLRSPHCLVDNLFAQLWKQVGMNSLLKRCGFQKRSGIAANEVMYCLTLWVWFKVNSVSLFARESMGTFCQGGKDVLYEAMKREDWDWRNLHRQIALKVVRQISRSSAENAFVLDDTIKIRHGKTMPGVSSHFDHTTGRAVMGQQILQLGLSCEDGFVPVDSELFISKVKAKSLTQAFQDGRSIAAKRYRVAQHQSKPEMAKAMISRALRAGIQATYLLADAWFGTKQIIRLAEDALLTAILRMKKNKMNTVSVNIKRENWSVVKWMFVPYFKPQYASNGRRFQVSTINRKHWMSN